MHVEIRRDFARLAIPSVLVSVVHHLFRLNDQLFVQPVGVEAQAAIAVGSMCAIFFVAFGEMVGIGTLAIAARRFGEGKDEEGRGAIQRGLRLAMIVGACITGAAFFGIPYLTELLIPGSENALERGYCNDYLAWIAGGQTVMLTVQVLDHGFLAMKDSRTPLALQILAVSTNALLNWLLVPKYGVHGIGFATVMSRVLALMVGLVVLRWRGVGFALFHPSGTTRSLRILRIGFPNLIGISVYSIVYQVILATTLTGFGPEARTALGIGFGIETIFYCLYWGVGNATASLVGRYLGEGDTWKVMRTARLAATVNLVLGLLVAAAFVLLGDVMVGWFTNDPRVEATNAEYLRYMAVAQPFQALQVAFDYVLLGAGYTFPIMVTTTLMNFLRVPLAHVFALTWGWGLPGVWWAINLSSIGKALGSGVLFNRRRWLHTKV